jgi:hypothetical protein
MHDDPRLTHGFTCKKRRFTFGLEQESRHLEQ